jgi:hypothetical protein
MRLEFIDEMGLIKLVDSSLFPTLRSMDWADYKKIKKSIRLHLEFDLNRMIPTEFIAQKANSSERTFLASILKKGMTYVAERGYFSFELGNTIKNAKAFLVMRVKSNLKLTILKSLEFSTGQEKLPSCFKNFSDQIILFSNDKFKQEYRLVKFSVLQSDFIICTNRFDLTSLQIIMLYAYRWQIELLFKFLKRTLNGIHLFNNSENGVNIQFYIFMIVIILELRLKQICQQKFAQTLESKKEQEKKEQKQKEKENKKSRQYTENSPEIKSNRGTSSYSINKKIQRFASRTVTTFQGLSSEFKPSSTDSYNYLSINYKVLFSSSRFVSIQFDKSMKLVGSEKPFQETKTLNYDLADNSIIRLSDILESKSQEKLVSLIRKYSGVEMATSEITNSTQFGLEDSFLVLKLKKEGDRKSHLYKLPWYGMKDILLKKGIGYELYEMNSRF